MIKAFAKSIRQLFDPSLRGVVIAGLIISLATMGVLWAAVSAVLATTNIFSWNWLEYLADTAASFIALTVAWFLFPAVVSVIIGFMTESVARAVEEKHYPGLGPERSQTAVNVIAATLKFALVAIALNLLALPVYLLLLFFPPTNLFVFYGLNGYLLGREYFELVAFRRVDARRARAMRRDHRGKIIAAGVLIAVLMTFPVVNLVAPIIATAVMVHLLEDWRHEASF